MIDARIPEVGAEHKRARSWRCINALAAFRGEVPRISFCSNAEVW
jgi:hypothetical protein